MACHVVLWIPTIVYQDFSDKEDCIEKNISDIPGKELFVKVSLSLNGNIQIDKKDPNGQFVPFVFLKRESVSSNGLMSYRYKSTSDNNNGFRFTTTEFPSAIYHIIKSFYHKHEFHDKESDSSIKPFVSSSLVDIKTCDNKALCHYLKSYGGIISNFVNTSDALTDASTAVKH